MFSTAIVNKTLTNRLYFMTYSSGITAQWHKLITDAQLESGVQLDLPIESYLVHTLINYTQRPEIAARIFAIDYLLAQHEQGRTRNLQLREIADQCLLYAGLFPQHSKRRNVSVSYYVDIGRGAYSDLSQEDNAWSDIFAELSDNFVTLMDTLLAIHHLDSNEPDDYILDPILALKTWQQTQSKQALKIFQQQTRSSNIVDFTSRLPNRRNIH